MCTTRSGRSAPSSPTTCSCSVKSQCSVSPASSTSRRSVSSPQRPRTSGRRSAVTRLRVSRCSCAWPPASVSICVRRLAKASRRSRSSDCTCASVRSSAARSGSTSCAIATSRSLSAPCGDHLVAPERLARQAQEQLTVAAQRLRRPARIEGGAQARLGLLEQPHPVGCPAARSRLEPHAAPRPAARAAASMRCAARRCASSAPSSAPVSRRPRAPAAQ